MTENTSADNDNIIVNTTTDNIVDNTATDNLTTTTYGKMLKNVKKAKSEGRDTFEYFVKSAVNSEAYKLQPNNKMIECKENAAGMTLIFICMALIKSTDGSSNSQHMVLLLKSHLTSLLKLRTSTNIPLCVISEEEGVMFPGEGMSLRFLNSLIILESLLLSRLTGKSLESTWSLYSNMDLILYLELPGLLNGILSDAELTAYAKMIEKSDGLGEYEKERRQAGKLIRSLRTSDSASDRAADSVAGSAAGSEGMNINYIVLGIIVLFLYTSLVIKLSR